MERNFEIATRTACWRASEASETLSGLFNRESRIYIYIIYIQVKKKAFKINAKIEDVGLNED